MFLLCFTYPTLCLEMVWGTGNRPKVEIPEFPILSLLTYCCWALQSTEEKEKWSKMGPMETGMLLYLRTERELGAIRLNPSYFKMSYVNQFPSLTEEVGRKPCLLGRFSMVGIWLHFFKSVQWTPGVIADVPRHPAHSGRVCCGAPEAGDEKIQLPSRWGCLIRTLYHSPA